MLRQEVEALLKIEGLKLYVRVHPWQNGNWRVGINEVWEAEVGFHLPTTDKEFRMCSAWSMTNHQAATNAYKKHMKFKNITLRTD